MEQQLVEKPVRKRRKREHVVLYVDDEPSNLRIFKLGFGRHYHVLTAEDAFEALEILKQHKIHVLITDERMPGMTGTQLLEKILPDYPDLIKIILTGFADIQVIKNAVNKCGIYKYITKPWDQGEMKMTLDKALETQQLKQDNKVLLDRLQESNRDLELKVKERTAALEVLNERLIDQLTFALPIQQAILPDEAKMTKSFSDHLIFFRPLHVVSGDFYWNFRIKERREDFNVIASVDCTGHGVSGALMSMIGYSLLNQIVQEKGIFDAALILEFLNRGIQDLLNQAETENGYGMDIGLVIIDNDLKCMHFAGARQPLIYFQNGEAQLIKGDRVSIGGEADKRKFFTKTTIDLDETTTFYLGSDGFKDQLGGPDFKKLGQERMLACLKEIHTEPFEVQRQKLSEHFDQWKGEEEQTDDVLLMGFKVGGQ